MAEKPRYVHNASVRLRVTATAAIAVLVLLTISGGGLLLTQRRQLTNALKDRLTLRTDDLALLLRRTAAPRVIASPGGEDTFAQVLNDEGRVVAASPGASRHGPIANVGAEDGFRRSHVGFDNDEFLVLTRNVPSPRGPSRIIVAGSLGIVGDASRALTEGLLVAVPATTLLIAALTWALVGRTLRPVEAIRTQVAEIGTRNLDRRVPVPATGDEVARLAGTMNQMLARLEEATARQDRFVADAAHELKTPLARLRSEIEVDLAYPDRSDFVATHHSVLAETLALQKLVEDLLHLARSDAGAPISRANVDLDDVVMEEVQRFSTETSVSVETGAVSAAQVGGDRSGLARVIRNLLENAVRHAHSTVEVAVREENGYAVVAVTDDGPGVDPSQRARIFERFARADEARDSTEGGTGLGLAIAREIAIQHGGELDLESSGQTGARFVLRIPTDCA